MPTPTLLLLLACTSGTTTQDSDTPDPTDTGPFYDNSYCEQDGLTDPQQACCDYVAAYNTCAETYGSSDWKDGETTNCDESGETSQPIHECLADVYTNADCTTPDGWNQAIQDATGC